MISQGEDILARMPNANLNVHLRCLLRGTENKEKGTSMVY